jgi:hypothetical protein
MNKKNLLSEELKRHQQLFEYTFYVDEDDDDTKDINGDLLLDDMYLTEQDPTGDEVEDPFADIGDEETPEGETDETTAGEDPFADMSDIDVPSEDETEETTDAVDPFGTDVEVEDEFAMEEPLGDDDTVEVDVTDIIDKTEETKTSVDGVSTKMDDLMSKLSDLETQVSGMDNVITKIDDLEKEIERRNPTPVERLEMRSMDSFPYSVKLTDFWKDKEGYDATEEEEEFTLTQSDVENFDDKEIRASFNSNNEDKEENI